MRFSLFFGWPVSNKQQNMHLDSKVTMISLQAQIQQMGIGAAGANGEVRYGSMFNDFDNDITSKIKIHPNIMQNSNIHARVEMQ